jgi:hypothetical protein
MQKEELQRLEKNLGDTLNLVSSYSVCSLKIYWLHLRIVSFGLQFSQ